MRRAKGYIEEIQRGHKYRIFISTGKDPATGKRQRRTATVRGNKSQAEKKLLELLLKYNDTQTASTAITLNQFWNAFYLIDIQQRLRATTVQSYTKSYEQFLALQLGETKLRDIDPLKINNWLLSIDGAKRKFHAFKILRQMLNKAKKLALLPYNPCDNVQAPPNVQDYNPAVLTASDAQAYLQHFKNTNIETAILIALGAGLRRSEIVALDWRDIVRGIITVDNAITSVAGLANDDLPKSQFSIRKVHLPPSINERLEQLRCADDVPVVQNTEGGRINPDNLTKEYVRLRNQLPAGVLRIPFKNLRHTSLTLTAEAGVDIFAVSRRAGHSSINITSRYYLRPHESIDINAANKLDTVFA